MSGLHADSQCSRAVTAGAVPDRAHDKYHQIDRQRDCIHCFQMAASGLALAVQAGLPDVLLGTSGMSLPQTLAGYAPRTVHGAPATMLLALVALHVLAALYHQLVRKDRLLARMGLGRRPSTP